MKALPISAYIIGFNEEKKIEDCLQSLKSVVDEIIYVDSYSQDNTVNIVKKYTDKIYFRSFDGYTNQKNYAQSLCKHAWVLNLDCDERLSQQARQELLKHFYGICQDKTITGISFPRLTFYLYRFMRHGGWYPDRKIRLVRKDACLWQGGKLHEEMHCPGKVVALKGDILHYSFLSIDDHLKTIQKFSELAAQDLLAQGKKANLYTIIARSFWTGFRKFFLEFSFLDGAAGIIMTFLSVTATWCKYSKLYLLCQHNNKSKK